MGSSLATRLRSGAPGAGSLSVTVEFLTPKKGDEVPGLGFTGPRHASGSLPPSRVAALCVDDDVRWLDSPPQSFMGSR